jgi:predicted transglutaminase-like cysteine proteinase
MEVVSSPMMLFSRSSAIFRKVLGKSLPLAFGFAAVPLLYAALPSLEKAFQLAQARYGPPAALALNQWREMTVQAQHLPEREKMIRVNDFFNHRVQFKEDAEIWGKADYWATPLETMGRAEGDCEDFAIAKYVTLKNLDVPIEKLRMTYVRAQVGGNSASQAHMVLSYYPSPKEEPLILDNLIGEIRPASRRADLYPIFSFNSEGLWVGSGTSEKASGSSTARLSRWRDLIARMRAEGFE